MPLQGFNAALQALGGLPTVQPPVAPPRVGLPAPSPTFPASAGPAQAVPSAAGGGLERILSLIAPMLTLGTALSGNRAAAAGSATGLVQGQVRQREIAEQQQLMQMRQQQMADQQAAREEAARLRQEQEERQRVETIVATSKLVNQQVQEGAFKTKAQYDAYIDGIEQMLLPLGVRPHTIRAQAPYRAPDFSKAMTKALDDYFGSDLNKAAIEAGDPKLFMGTIQIDTDGDGKPDKPIPILDAIKEAGYNKVMLDPTGKPVVMPKAKPNTSVQLDDERFLGALERFTVDKGRVPTQAERGEIASQVQRDIAKETAAGRREGAPPISLQIGTGGLAPRVQSRVDAQAKAFDASPVVKRTQLLAEARSFVNSLDINTQNPGDDQALIYAFAKAMDPDSVVREGEYATVQKYSQTWLSTLGFNAQRVATNTEFLTPQARANLRATIQKRYEAAKRQYDAVRGSYVTKINRITGQPDGDTYLTDYALDSSPVSAGSAPPTSNPYRK